MISGIHIHFCDESVYGKNNFPSSFFSSNILLPICLAYIHEIFISWLKQKPKELGMWFLACMYKNVIHIHIKSYHNSIFIQISKFLSYFTNTYIKTDWLLIIDKRQGSVFGRTIAMAYEYPCHAYLILG